MSDLSLVPVFSQFGLYTLHGSVVSSYQLLVLSLRSSSLLSLLPDAVFTAMAYVYVYWDDSNIFISAKSVGAEQEGDEVRSRVRVHFSNLMKLAGANREVKWVMAAGSIPPELKQLWTKMEEEGVSMQLFDRHGGGEQQTPDIMLQLGMLSDTS